LLLVSLLSSLVLIEIGYRAAAGLPVFKLANWRSDVLSKSWFGDRIITDPVLGWMNLPWTDYSGNWGNFETIDYGIRRNFDETTVRTGAVLAVGDSFTEGWEVEGEKSWPAVLEGMTGVPVVNAGIGGYGTDQIILRAEQLLPIVKPKILIIGFLDDDILRAGHSIYNGAPKPYFTTENGELRYHPPARLQPRESESLMSSIGYTLRDGLGYFATADYVLARLSPDYWYGTESEMFYHRTDVDEVAVTCALLRRLKTQTDKDGIRVLVFLQYYAPLILSSEQPGPNSLAVKACAEAIGIRVVDQFASLRSIVITGPPNVIREYYWYSDGIFGHMTAKGNMNAAILINSALRDWLPGMLGWSSQTRAEPPAVHAPDGAGALQP